MFLSIRKFAIILASAAFVLPVFAIPTASDAVVPGDVAIDEIVYGGTGCPRGSASIALSSDRKSFSASFKKFTAYINTDTGNIKDSRKFCQLNIAIRNAPGWQFTIVDTSFTGYASLSQKVIATHESTYYFTGESREQSFSAIVRGPTYQNYNIRAATIVGSGQWSPCGSETLLNIKSELLLTGQGYGAIRETKGTGSVSRIYGLQWRKC